MTNSYVPEGRLFGTAENTELTRNESGLRTAWQSGRILESIVAFCGSDLGLRIDLGAYEGVIPRDEALFVSGGDIKDIAVISRVGKPVCFIISELGTEGGKKTAYLSRTAAQKECIDRYLSYLCCGDIIDCRVTHTERFGVFIELSPNLSGLSEFRGDVEPGDEVAVYIKSIDERKMKVKLVIVGVQGKARPSPIRYFVSDKVSHIYSFIYSTPSSQRMIHTDFT